MMLFIDSTYTFDDVVIINAEKADDVVHFLCNFHLFIRVCNKNWYMKKKME